MVRALSATAMKGSGRSDDWTCGDKCGSPGTVNCPLADGAYRSLFMLAWWCDVSFGLAHGSMCWRLRQMQLVAMRVSVGRACQMSPIFGCGGTLSDANPDGDGARRDGRTCDGEPGWQALKMLRVVLSLCSHGAVLVCNLHIGWTRGSIIHFGWARVRHGPSSR
jgi:hypothetical protein